jgi:hypothetical protein
VSAGLLGYQVLNQNGASVLGVVLLPVVAAGVLGARERSPVRVPLWVSAVLLSAVAGVYSELMVTLGPALFVGFVVGDKLLPAVRRFAGLVALSLLASPLAWLNTYRSLVITGSASGVWDRKVFRIGSASQILSHYTGVIGLDETAARMGWAIVVVIIIVVGLVGLRSIAGLAPFAYSYAALNAVLVAQMVRTHTDYTLERVVMLAQPTLLLLAVIGLATMLHRWTGCVTRPSLSDARRRPSLLLRERRSVLAAALVALLVLGVVQERTVHASTYVGADIVHRSVRDELVHAAAAVRAVGASDGADVLVSDADLVDRLWLADLLRDRPQVAWTQLTTDYFFTPSFVGAARPRWFLVDDAGWHTAGAGPSFGNLQLIDASGAPFTQVVPLWEDVWKPDPSGGSAQSITTAGSLLVVRSNPGAPLTLRVWSTDAGGAPGTIQVVGGAATSGVAGATATELSVQLPAATVVTLAFTVKGTWYVEPVLRAG